jgi:hypothetical protein
MFSQPFIQNEIENYYTKQVEKSLDGSINTYYGNQVGSGGGFYSGVRYQKADILGGLLASFGRIILPLLKPMAKVVGRQALKVVPELAVDVLAGNPAVKSLTNRVRQGETNALLELTGKKQLKRKKAKKQKRKVGVISSQLEKRWEPNDIFTNKK